VGETLGSPPTPHDVFGFSGTLATSAWSLAYPVCSIEALRRLAANSIFSTVGRRRSWACYRSGETPKGVSEIATPSLTKLREGVNNFLGAAESTPAPPPSEVARFRTSRIAGAVGIRACFACQDFPDTNVKRVQAGHFRNRLTRFQARIRGTRAPRTP